jgi:hypothetical protein
MTRYDGAQGEWVRYEAHELRAITGQDAGAGAAFRAG